MKRNKIIAKVLAKLTLSEEVSKEIKKIDISKFLISRESMMLTMRNISGGKPSLTRGPLEVFEITEGTHKGHFLLTDGHHRLFAEVLKGHKKVDVVVYEGNSGSTSDTPYAVPTTAFKFTNSKYGGLENLADEEVLKDLLPKV